MKNNIQQILKDIYMIDPVLKDREKELVKVIEKLLKNKPDIVIDNNFINNLRSDLLLTENLDPVLKDKMNTNIMSKLYYAFGGAVTMAAVMFIAFNLGLSREQKQIQLNDSLSFVSGSINKLENNAFGVLGGTDSKSGTLNVGESAPGIGGGGAMVSRDLSSSIVAPESDGDVAMIKMIAHPDPTIYKYVYEGELKLNDAQKEVYRKVASKDLAKNFAGLIGGVDFDMIDLSKFQDMSLKNFRVGQDIDLGYDVFVDLESGNLSVNENNRGWYEPFDSSKCDFRGYCGPERLTMSDIPDDKVLIATANKFLSDKKVNMSNYGSPKADNRWKEQYETTEDKNNFYIPDIVGVIYPLIINGKEIKDMEGNDYGMRVNINIRKQKVAGFYGLAVNDYESSMYETETDKEKIMKFVEQGGYRGYYYENYIPENARVELVKLGEPAVKYVSYMQYINNLYQEIFVPSLVFPIIEKPKGMYFYRESVVIPLVKDLLKMDIERPIEPMPLLRGPEIMEDEAVKTEELEVFSEEIME